MNETIIKIEGLGKKNIISHEQVGGYTALRDVISKEAKDLRKKREWFVECMTDSKLMRSYSS